MTSNHSADASRRPLRVIAQVPAGWNLVHPTRYESFSCTILGTFGVYDEVSPPTSVMLRK